MACNTNYISWDREGGGGGKMAELPHSARTAPLAPLVAGSNPASAEKVRHHPRLLGRGHASEKVETALLRGSSRTARAPCSHRVRYLNDFSRK